MDTGKLLFDFAHDTYRLQLEQMRGTQARNALILVSLSVLTLVFTIAVFLMTFGLGGAAIMHLNSRLVVALYNLPLALAFLSLLTAVVHLGKAAGQRLHVSLVSGAEWRKVREEYRKIRHHAASDEDLTIRFLPSLLDASEQNAHINERERSYSRAAMVYAVYALTLLIVHVLLHYTIVVIGVAGGLTRLM